MNKFLFVPFVLFFLVSSLNGQIISDRPGISESSYTLEKSHFQLQSGLFSSYLKNNQSNTITNRLRFGLGKGFDLIADFNYGFNRVENKVNNDFDPLAIGFRKSLCTSTNGNQMAVQFTTGIPLSKTVNLVKRNPYASRFGFFLDQSINKINLAFNIGFEGTYTKDTYLLNSFYTVSFSTGKTLSPFIEIFGATPSFDNFSLSELTVNLDAGAAYVLSDVLLIDISAGITNLDKTHQGWILDFGFTWKVNTKKD